MLLECVGQPFTYRWPGGEVHLTQGKPIAMPDERARRLLMKAPGKVRVIDPALACQPGTTIAWLRGDGSTQTALVDCLHADDSGTRWAFVTTQGSWAAVNLKFLQW